MLRTFVNGKIRTGPNPAIPFMLTVIRSDIFNKSAR